MATVTVYREGVEAAPLARQRQQAFTAPDGVGEGLQTLGRGLNQFAQAKDAYQARVDEATANTLDADFSEAVREIERGYLNTKGMNAVDQAKAANEAWEQTKQSFQARATNPRQQQMLDNVLARREARWRSQYDSHLTTQTDVWADDAEKSRISTMSVDVADLPVGSEERLEATVGLGAVLDERGRRLGWDAATRQAEGVAVFSGIHTATVNSLIDGGDPVAAREYFEANRENILPAQRTGMDNRVREAWEGFVADREIRGSFLVDNEPEVEVAVDGQRQTVKLGQPVNARVGSRYGARRSPGGVGSSNHGGVDYPVPVNTPVSASAPGIVRIKNDPDGYGTYVVVDHGDGLETRYAHLNSVNVRDGQRVEQGDTIAMSGGARGAPGAGNSQGPHLHYEVRRNGATVNPETMTGQSVSVAPGSPKASGLPTTPEDVREWAGATAERLGGDWRLRQRLEQAGYAEISRNRSDRADRESEARRELDRYLPGGDSEAAGSDGVPPAIWNAVSPSDRRQARNAWEAEQKRAAGETEAVDKVRANDLFAALLDEAAADPDTFMSRDLNGYRGQVTETQFLTLRTTARTLSTGGGEAADAIKGMDGVINAYARQVGITTGQNAKPEDAERMSYLRSSLLQSVDGFRQAQGKWPDQSQIIGMMRVLTAPATNGRREGRLFETGGQINVPRGERRRIIRELQNSATPILNPTEDQIRLAYTQSLQR